MKRGRSGHLRVAAAMCAAVAVFGALAVPIAGCGGSSSPTVSSRQFPLSTLPTADVTIAGRVFHVWIASTAAQRQEGLMFVPAGDLAGDRGMLFVFPDTAARSFWMKNTPAPLDIVFVGGDRRVLNVAHGTPYDLSPLSSAGAPPYVLEVSQGAAAASAITTGVDVTLPANLPPGQ